MLFLILVNEYLSKLKENYNYSYEQALGILYWKNYDFKEAFNAINDFIPQTLDCWTLDDNIRFQSACAIVGKDFVRIEKMVLNAYFYLKYIIKLI